MTTPTLPQLTQAYHRVQRRDRCNLMISRAWAWLFAVLVAITITLAMIAAFNAALDSIMIAKASSPTAIIAARGW